MAFVAATLATGAAGGGGMNRSIAFSPNPSFSSRAANNAHGVPGASLRTRRKCASAIWANFFMFVA